MKLQQRNRRVAFVPIAMEIIITLLQLFIPIAVAASPDNGKLYPQQPHQLL